jgi:hypothetical protein
MAPEWNSAAGRSLSYQPQIRSGTTQCWQLVASTWSSMENYRFLQSQEESSWPATSSRSVGGKIL